jgi:hypothetical protein
MGGIWSLKTHAHVQNSETPFLRGMVDADTSHADRLEDQYEVPVIDTHGQVIAGLYAAGETAAGSLCTACRGSRVPGHRAGREVEVKV